MIPCAMLTATGAVAAAAAIDDDSAALSLPGDNAAAPGAPSPLSLTTEAAATEAGQRSSGTEREQRLSFDLRYDHSQHPSHR